MEKVFYPAIFHPEDVGFSVVVPDVQGCVTQGDTLDAAFYYAKEAIGLCLEETLENGEAIPVASNPKKFNCENDDFVVLVEFDMISYKKKYDNKAVKKTLTIPSWLNAMAEENKINFSAVLQDSLKQHLHIEDRM